MQFSEFKAKTKKWNQFSQIDTLGSYDFYTSIVSLESLKKADIIQMKNAFKGEENLTPLHLGREISSDQFELLKKIFPLAAHEYTHFVDATSTLWGLRHLNMMNAAYLADDAKGGNENDFHHAKSFYDHIRLVRLPNYYTLINNDAVHTVKWRATITTGKIYSNDGSISNRSIIFSRFESDTGTFLARSPISTISILEASAMAQEVLFHTFLINSTREEFKTVETVRYSKELLNYLYNHKITEYSVCVHLVANHLNCKDILASFIICALLTRIVLNFPNQAFEQVLKNCKFNEILEIPIGEYEFINYIRSGIEKRDLGTLFYLLCRALPKDSSESPRVC